MQQMPKGRDVDDDDSFVFNDTFTAPLYRIKVPKFITKGTKLTDFKLSFKF
jgi:cullin-4